VHCQSWYGSGQNQSTGDGDLTALSERGEDKKRSERTTQRDFNVGPAKRGPEYTLHGAWKPPCGSKLWTIVPSLNEAYVHRLPYNVHWSYN